MLCQCVVGATGFDEDNSCDPTADTIRTIGDGGTLHRANRFAKIFLMKKNKHRVSPLVCR